MLRPQRSTLSRLMAEVASSSERSSTKPKRPVGSSWQLTTGGLVCGSGTSEDSAPLKSSRSIISLTTPMVRLPTYTSLCFLLACCAFAPAMAACCCAASSCCANSCCCICCCCSCAIALIWAMSTAGFLAGASNADLRSGLRGTRRGWDQNGLEPRVRSRQQEQRRVQAQTGAEARRVLSCGGVDLLPNELVKGRGACPRCSRRVVRIGG
mmetsp:Transcript_29043/g.72762  ORF Transcript_29043/g.72762 Transcript_29043/m.72762 type:complete len:210 (+) Transcript_29043:1023-1652(+)